MTLEQKFKRYAVVVQCDICLKTWTQIIELPFDLNEYSDIENNLYDLHNYFFCPDMHLHKNSCSSISLIDWESEKASHFNNLIILGYSKHEYF
ncbi:MAG: hypothetical protein BWY04_01020 [candidate division CPR1 bacterium ADurb.Bin160]|uniref:Uncharacterized protein n=1 Tax=candidate division CPR1 bacterium ADurb.Bin160 TaxID=1852826 RepID=A0A1V5ZMH5_9BACT|nr:MAG: hypothetical protein BWY04_01020 [candidate division CPR1 bacterium ADurb.Bin160]